MSCDPPIALAKWATGFHSQARLLGHGGRGDGAALDVRGDEQRWAAQVAHRTATDASKDRSCTPARHNSGLLRSGLRLRGVGGIHPSADDPEYAVTGARDRESRLKDR
jgi:hypothetical protein